MKISIWQFVWSAIVVTLFYIVGMGAYGSPDPAHWDPVIRGVLSIFCIVGLMFIWMARADQGMELTTLGLKPKQVFFRTALFLIFTIALYIVGVVTTLEYGLWAWDFGTRLAVSTIWLISVLAYLISLVGVFEPEDSAEVKRIKELTNHPHR